jgi:ribosomal protein L24E
MNARKDGSVVFACKTKEQKEKLEQEIRKKGAVTVRDIPRMNPH